MSKTVRRTNNQELVQLLADPRIARAFREATKKMRILGEIASEVVGPTKHDAEKVSLISDDALDVMYEMLEQLGMSPDEEGDVLVEAGMWEYFSSFSRKADPEMVRSWVAFEAAAQYEFDEEEYLSQFEDFEDYV